MDEIKKILIVGLGAIGGVCAAKIFSSSRHVLRILVDEKRLAKYKKEKTFVNGVLYNFEYVLPSEKFSPDLIIIATKCNDLKEVLKSVKNFVGEETIILSLLNGISSEEQIKKVYKKSKTLFSFYIGHAVKREGRKITYDGCEKIVFGEKSNKTVSKEVSKVHEFFNSVNIKHEIPTDMEREYWKKFLLNVGVNQASAVFKADYGKIQSTPKIYEFMKNLMAEVQAIAAAKQISNPQTLAQEGLECFAVQPRDAKTSMLQDIEAGRKTEVEFFVGEVVRLGKKYQTETPFNQNALKTIKRIGNKPPERVSR